MSESDAKPQDAYRLFDEELGFASGVYWSYEEEQEWQSKWQKLKDGGARDLPPYEEWLKNELAEYDAWTIRGSAVLDLGGLSHRPCLCQSRPVAVKHARAGRSIRFLPIFA